jgi:DNA-directed RNA polymerase subunit K/omega
MYVYTGDIMKIRIDSRTSQLDNEKCVNNATGRYDLVLMASQRLRELRKKARETNKHVTCIDALLDVQNGLVDPADYLAKIK